VAKQPTELAATEFRSLPLILAANLQVSKGGQLIDAPCDIAVARGGLCR
jgi:hypothetical protein